MSILYVDTSKNKDCKLDERAWAGRKVCGQKIQGTRVGLNELFEVIGKWKAHPPLVPARSDVDAKRAHVAFLRIRT
jgi:hypothetical protein